MSEWISVKDSVPTCYKDVLVWLDDEMFVAYFNGERFRFNFQNFTPTHWQELPEPPKE